MDIAPLLLNGAYVSLASAAFMRRVLFLRILLVAGACFFIAFGLIREIRSMVIWNVLIGGLHLSRLVRDVRAQRSVNLTDRDRAVRDSYLPGMTDFDFNILWRLGQDVAYTDQVIIEQGTRPNTVSLILSGIVAIERNGEVFRGTRRGGLIGEMSFVSGQVASATVRAKGRVELHQWDQMQLGALDQVHPSSARAFRRLIERDLVAKARTP